MLVDTLLLLCFESLLLQILLLPLFLLSSMMNLQQANIFLMSFAFVF